MLAKSVEHGKGGLEIGVVFMSGKPHIIGAGFLSQAIAETGSQLNLIEELPRGRKSHVGRLEVGGNPADSVFMRSGEGCTIQSLRVWVAWGA